MAKGLTGAAFHKASGKWQARIMLDGERKHLGYHDSEEEAHAAYLKARGEVQQDRAKVEKLKAREMEAILLAAEQCPSMFHHEFALVAVQEQDEGRAVLFTQLARLCHRLQAPPQVVSAVMLIWNDEPYDSDREYICHDDLIAARVETLKALDLWDKAGEIADGVKGGVSFEKQLEVFCDFV